MTSTRRGSTPTYVAFKPLSLRPIERDPMSFITLVGARVPLSPIPASDEVQDFVQRLNESLLMSWAGGIHANKLDHKIEAALHDLTTALQMLPQWLSGRSSLKATSPMEGDFVINRNWTDYLKIKVSKRDPDGTYRDLGFSGLVLSISPSRRRNYFDKGDTRVALNTIRRILNAVNAHVRGRVCCR